MQNCTVKRTMLIRHETWDMKTGKTTPEKNWEEWVTKACGVPLFDAAEKKNGICRHCAAGWNHPENYRADSPRPEKVLSTFHA